MSHFNETRIDADLVSRLLRSQFPRWAHLPLEPVDSAGTDNAIYRLGERLAVRLPRVEWAVGQAEKEHRWLPKLAPHLPIAIPVPLALGSPDEEYPWHWSVYEWLEGENAGYGLLGDPREAAAALGRFVAALQRVDSAGGPPPGAHNSGRGVPLAMRDTPVREALAALRDTIDTITAAAIWEEALQAPVWTEPPVWLHGDLHPGNLLVGQGRLRAVIDFGTLGVGDPACDAMAAWTFLSSDTRADFRAALPIDDATWIRGRGWALSFGLIAYAYYKHTNPVLAGISRRAIDEVLADRHSAV